MSDAISICLLSIPFLISILTMMYARRPQHKWAKWVPYMAGMTKIFRGKEHYTCELWEKRHCETCGKTQDRKVGS